jgi:ATP-dependent Clp protease ATP-binding subunit ClpA
VRQDLEDFIDTTKSRVQSDGDVRPTPEFQRILQRAVFHAQSSDKKPVTTADVLVATFSEKHSHAVYLLSIQQVSRLDVVNCLRQNQARL